MTIQQDIERVLSEPASKLRTDLSNRLAYVYITGAFPTHLRHTFMAMLVGLTSPGPSNMGLKGSHSAARIDDVIIRKLDLSQHPMVTKVAEYIAQGFRLAPAPSANTRRTFSRIYLCKGPQRIVVKSDGAVLDQWPAELAAP